MKGKILTFGSCGWDRIFRKNTDGSTELIYEEEGRKNSHQAIAAKRACGCISTLVSFVGDDETGKQVLQSLRNSGIDTKYITVVKGQKTEINHQYIIEETKEYELERGPAELSQWYTPDMAVQYKKEILSSDFVILVSKQPKDFLTSVIDLCYKNKIPAVLTASHPKFDVLNNKDLETLKKCTFIAVNFEEMKALTKKDTCVDALKILPNLIITKGADGVWFINEEGKICHEDSVPPEEVVETNGAGDTFIGNFMVFYSEGKNLKECVRMSMCASSIEISKMGVLNVMPYRAETEELYNKHFVTLNNSK